MTKKRKQTEREIDAIGVSQVDEPEASEEEPQVKPRRTRVKPARHDQGALVVSEDEIPSTVVDDWLRNIESKYGERRRLEFRAEAPALAKYLPVLLRCIQSTYALERVLDVGGTGVVLVGRHTRFHQPVVVKFNRPNTPRGEKSMVANEATVLPTLNHPNIIRVLDIGTIETEAPPLTYIVEPYIEGSRPFFTPNESKVAETWLRRRVTEVKAALPDPAPGKLIEDPGRTVAAVTDVLAQLSGLFAQWLSLLVHIHKTHDSAEHGYVYLDVKPDNILVDAYGHLTSIDYGSVEQVCPDDFSPLQVFFTDRYAHPFLLERKVEKPSSNRVRGAVRRSELWHALDYYALGISMLEILNEVAGIRTHVVPQLPLYRALHFLASRLLDGKNSARKDDNRYPLAWQVFPGLTERDYADLKYTELSTALRDIHKERGEWSLEDQVPELATYSKDIVRVVPGFNTVLTPRLRGVIEHPLVARLKYVSQLGLVSLVYPTADHARYDHALGSYTYTTNYVKSLFNDLGNPVFRNMVGVEDLNAVLLAALLHDLGQYPLAHDLEEVHDGIFKHGRIGIEFLEDDSKDSPWQDAFRNYQGSKAWLGRAASYGATGTQRTL